MKKNGDNGTTTTLFGQTLSKNDVLVHFEGTTDELNAHLGLVKAVCKSGGVKAFIEKIQRNMIRLTAHVTDRNNSEYYFGDDALSELENAIADLYKNVPTPTKFILPGKDVQEAHIHIARAVARRAERAFVAVCESANDQPNPNVGAYLNRLSEYLFVLSLQ